jgi:adenine-specific DNA-methyltransferase
MASNYEKFRTLLQELFQLDQADLDFGIYRIMNQKRDEIVRFLDNDLLPQVQSAFGQYRSADKTAVQNELDKLVESVKSARMNPDESPAVQELRATLADSSVDVTALESEVFSHLYSFFRRYYHEGDFLSLRRYKEGVYAIPYEGEEVKLHWANADQYYVKSSEYLREYAFTLPGDKSVHFRLVAGSAEQNNNKAASGKERRFILVGDSPVVEENGVLVVGFEYRPSEGQEKQADLNRQAVEMILGARGLDDWTRALRQPAPTESNGRRTVLEKHLTQYTARNTFDYFIHKDLGGFLRRELDFYIKNEVMHLDDIEHDTAPKVEQYLSQIKVIRLIAGKIIQFLAQIEDFQKKLWLKKKFVVETNYCITLDRVPEELYPEIAANDAQWYEWSGLFAITPDLDFSITNGAAHSTRLAFLRSHSHLPLDTSHFSSAFTERLVASFGDLSEALSGVLIHGDNFHALSLLSNGIAGKVDCVYIDPPYNTGADGFPYKDAYQHSSWLTMMENRLQPVLRLLARTGVLTVSIGREEVFHLANLLDALFGETNRVGDLVWEKGRKNDARYFSLGHDYILAYARDELHLSAQKTRWREEKPGAKEILQEFSRLKREHGEDLQAVEAGVRAFYSTLPVDHPSRKHRRFNRVDGNGLWRDHDISWPSEGGPRYDVPHPETGKPCRVPARGWRFATFEKFKLYEKHGFIEYREDHNDPPILKRYLNYVSTDFDPDTRRKIVRGPGENDETGNVQVMPSVFYKHSEQPVADLRNMMGADLFPNPKDPEVIARLLSYLTPSGGNVLDFFAGSGTTAQAVAALARSGQSARRRFWLVEAADHFDSVLKPRVLKALYSSEWSDGVPQQGDGLSVTVKCVRLESYDDTLCNLTKRKQTPDQNKMLFSDSDVREQYLLSYMLDVESRGSQSLLNVEGFRKPDEYKLKIERNGETQLINVDLVETFNWLLGLTVKHIDVIGSKDTGSVRIVEGTNPDGERALVLWRNCDETDNDALDRWFEKQGYNARDLEYDLIYVNGDNNLENLRRPDQTWKVRLIENEFQRLMFDTEVA